MNPYDDLPNAEETLCHVARCPHEWAWETPGGDRLCEDHSDAWHRAEGMLTVRDLAEVA